MNNMIVNKGGGEGGGVSPSPKQGSMIKDIMQKSQQQQQQQQSQSKMSYSKEKKISFQLHQGSNENSESRGGKPKKILISTTLDSFASLVKSQG